jgi:hypothetical protein
MTETVSGVHREDGSRLADPGHMTALAPDGGSGRPDSTDTASPAKAARVAWRPTGASVKSAGVPTALVVVAHPFLGVGLAILEAAALTVIGIALFGTPELSERAFRLLRWIVNRAEPPAPLAS